MKNLLLLLILTIIVSCGNSIEMNVTKGSATTTSGPLSFKAGYRIGFPLSFGDQNYPSSSAQTTSGDLFLASIVGDTPGWERWNIFKSTDNGVTFNKVDMFVPYEEGESHPLSMVAKGNDLYVCGYAWGSSRVEWYIRKTSNGGTTWTNSDVIINGARDVLCYDIDKSVSGNLYAVGYDGTDGIIRESTDNGSTWNTIYSTGAVPAFTAVKVSPLGVVWALGRDGSVYKGTFGAGWTFALAGTAQTVTSGPYEEKGDLAVLSETEALLSYGSAANWIIQRTVNGGTNWVTTFTSAGAGTGHSVKLLSSGEVLAIGNLFGVPRTLLIEKSIDNGATWSNVLSTNTPGQDGVSIVELNNGSIRAFGVQNTTPYQITNYISSDAGDSWTAGNDVRYKENLYDTLYDFKVDGNGNFWAAGFISYIDSNNREPWVVVKSSDKGLNWTNSDVFTDPVQQMYTSCLAIGPNNEVYAAGSETPSGDWVIRKTSDAGATWNEVDRSTDECKKMTVSASGDVFFIGNTPGNWVRKGSTNGTAWAQQVSFPVAVGSSNFQAFDIKAFPDGSLWVSGEEQNAGLVWEIVLYRSTDAGASYTEVFREPGLLSAQDIQYRNGDVYAISDMKVIKSSDDGATWTDVYDGTILGKPKDFAIDTNGKLFVLNGSSKILEQNITSGGYFLSLDYHVFNTNTTGYMNYLVDCGSSTGICGLANYQVSVLGSPWQFIPLDY